MYLDVSNQDFYELTHMRASSLLHTPKTLNLFAEATSVYVLSRLQRRFEYLAYLDVQYLTMRSGLIFVSLKFTKRPSW